MALFDDLIPASGGGVAIKGARPSTTGAGLFDDLLPAPAAAATSTLAKPAEEENSYLGNLARGIGERGVKLAAGMNDTTLAVLEAAGVDPDGWFMKNSRKGSEAAKKVDLGYEEGTSWEEVKASPLANFVPFAIEQGIVSAPDMAAALANLPAYIIARTGELGDKRAENNGLANATVEDLAKTLPAAAASALLERFSTKGILGIGEAATTGLKQVPGAIAKGALKEGATEGAQEIIEYTGTNLGTNKGFKVGEALDQAAAGAVGGVGFGGAVRAGTSTVEALTSKPAPAAAFDDLVPPAAPDAVAVQDTVVPVPADRERATSPRLTEADRASPIPNDLIDDGKAIIAGERPVLATPGLPQAAAGAPLSEAAPIAPERVLPTATPLQRATLRAAGDVDAAIDDMSPDEIASQVTSAMASGIRPAPADIEAATAYAPLTQGVATDTDVGALAMGSPAVGSVASPSRAGADFVSTSVPDLAGPERTDGDWQTFAPESGTLDIPRTEMPQIKAEHRGAMVNFLKGRGIAHREVTMPAADLKPTQREFSPEKVQKARDFTGGDRAILVSSDGHIVDGHHQWLAKLQDNADVRTITLDAPIADLLPTVAEFPSATLDDPAPKMPALAKRPVTAMLRKAGGVDPASPLAGNLRAMGITAKTAPGLFRKGGRGAADNFVRAENPLFANGPDDGNGYIPEAEIMEGLRREFSGDPLRTADEAERVQAAQPRGAEDSVAPAPAARPARDGKFTDPAAEVNRLIEVYGYADTPDIRTMATSLIEQGVNAQDAMVAAAERFAPDTVSDDIPFSIDNRAPEAPSRALRGWGLIEADAPPRLSQEEQDNVVEIVSRVAGLPSVQFKESISVPTTAEGAAAWGVKGEEGKTMDVSGYYSRLQDVVAVSLTSSGDGRKLAYHESFHRLQNLFLNDAERALLASETETLRKFVDSGLGREGIAARMSQKELEAEAFAIYSARMDAGGKAPLQIKGRIRAAWDRIRATTARVKNYLNGRGYQTLEDVFDTARSGETAKREPRATVTAAPARQLSVAPDAAPTEPVAQTATVAEAAPAEAAPQPAAASATEQPLGKILENLTAAVDRLAARDAAPAAAAETPAVAAPEPAAESPAAPAPRRGAAPADAEFSAVTDTPAFKQWFGDSKVVDAAGDPLVVYHGTASDFQSFSKSASAKHIELPGFFFTADTKIANRFSESASRKEFRGSDGYIQGFEGAAVMPVYLAVKNPAVINLDDAATGKMTGGNTVRKLLTEAKKSGHDGAIINGWTDGSGETQFVAFESTQIKSATGNIGTFDPDNPDINFSLAGALGTRMMDNIKKGKNDGETLGDYSHRKIIDYLQPVKRMIENVGGSVQDTMDVYLQARLTEDAALARIQGLHDTYVTPMVEAMAKSGVSLDELHRYMYAMHAPERNRVVGLRNEEGTPYRNAVTDPSIKGASGLSTNEANKRIADLSKDPAKLAAIKDAASYMRGLIDKNLYDQKVAGLISATQFDSLTKQWDHYVPLHAEEDGADGASSALPGAGRGFDVRGDEFKAATGRSTEAENIPAWIITTAERTQLRAQKNAVGRSVLRFLNAHDPAGTEIASVYWSESSPAIGNIQKAPTVYRREVNKTTGMVVDKKVPPSVISPDTFSVKVGGKAYFVQFKDEKVGMALKKMGQLDIDAISRFARKWTGWQSFINTRANPAFVPINIIRDAATGGIHLLDEGFTAKEAAGIVKNIPKAWASLWRNARGKPNTSNWDKALKEYIDAGGKTTFAPQTMIEDTIKDLQKAWKETAEGRSPPKKAWQAFVKFIGDLNDAGENGIRLATFIAARDKGVTTQRAAFMARDLTVDFKKHGEIGPSLNSWFVFFNASVQGNYNIAARLATSKTIRRASYTIIATGVLMDLLNRSLSGDDDDGESFYSKMLRNQAYKMERQIVLFYGPGKDDYFTIPMPYGYNAMHHLGVQASAAAFGDIEPLEAVMNSFRVAATAFNPIGGGGSPLNMVVPTILDPFVEVETNMGFNGQPISPTAFAGDTGPDAYRFFSSTPDAFRYAAELANSATGGNAVEPGLVDLSPDTIEYFWGHVTGGIGRFFSQAVETGRQAAFGADDSDTIKAEEIPIVKAFYGKMGDAAKRSEYYKQREAVQTVKSRLDDYKEAGDGGVGARNYVKRFPVEARAIPLFDAVEKRLKIVRKQKRAIDLDRDLSRLEKTAKIKPLEAVELRIMNQARLRYGKLRAANKAAEE